MNQLSYSVSRLLEMMAKGGGKTSTLDMKLLTETLEAIGWSAVKDQGVAKLTDDDQFKDHPSLKPWLSLNQAQTWGYAGFKEEKQIWFDSREEALEGRKTFPIQIGGAPHLGQLAVVSILKPSHSEYRIGLRGEWYLATVGWQLGVPAYRFTSKSGSSVTIPLSVDGRGRVADPNKTPMPAFWTWAYKNGLQAEAQAALASAVLLPKPAAPGDRTLDDTGTCPVCEANVKLARGIIMRHGWSVQGNRGRGQYGGSWHSGPCFGQGYEPWEISSKGASAWVAHLEKFKPQLEQSLHRLQSTPEKIPNPYSNDWNKRPPSLTPEDKDYKEALKSLIQGKIQEIENLEREIVETKARIAAWVPKALYSRVASRWLNGQ